MLMLKTAAQIQLKAAKLEEEGERAAMCGNWPEWFGKTWKDGDYYRTDHTCFAKPSPNGEIVHWCKWYHKASRAVTQNINVKACALNNVPADEILFRDEGMAAVVLDKYGEGTVSFFGDVNHEDETVQTIAIVARGC
jgi:hypothetical protein